MNADEFRRAMAALPEPPKGSAPPHWSYWRHDLWARGQVQPVESFWQWPCVRHTMIVDHFPIGRQLAYLQNDWDRWGPAVSGAEHETSYRNLVNLASHVRRWEQTTGTNVAELDSIFEFGAGYGAMVLVLRRAGFQGRLYTHDLPEFTLLQRWYLSQHGMADDVLPQSEPRWSDLFIATYSISEIPIEQRKQWLVAGFYLLLCSSRFADYDNLAWMRQVIADRPRLNWHEEQLEQRPDYYFFGWPK